MIKQLAIDYGRAVWQLGQRDGISWKAARFRRGPRWLSAGYLLKDPLQVHKALKIADAAAVATGSRMVTSNRAGKLVWFQVELPRSQWEFYTFNQLQSLDKPAIGLGEMRLPIVYDVTQSHTAAHTLVAGMTGSGKTEAIKTALLAMLRRTTPEKTGLYIIDPKRSKYAGFDNSAFLMAPIAYDADDISAVIQAVFNEMVRRKLGGIMDSRRIFLAIDEAHDAAILQPANVAALEQIGRLGREYGIHLIIGTQEIGKSDFGAVATQLGQRYVGMVSDASASAFITGQRGLEAHKLSGNGDFLHILPGSVARFQVAMTAPADYDTLPRGEIEPLQTVEHVDPARDLGQPTNDGPGRPPRPIEYVILGHYLGNWIVNRGHITISRRKAAEIFGITVHEHRKYLEALADVTRGIKIYGRKFRLSFPTRGKNG